MGQEGMGREGRNQGHYKLNATRAMLKLPLLDIKGYRQELEQNRERHSAAWQHRLVFTALSFLCREARICPTEHIPTRLSQEDMQLVVKYYLGHRSYLEIPDEAESTGSQSVSENLLSDPLERLAYVGGALDGQDMATTGHIRGAGPE